MIKNILYFFVGLLLLGAGFIIGCKMQDNEFEPTFGLGLSNVEYAKYVKGASYLNVLAKDQLNVINVTFEPKSRSNWHIHHGNGQILLVTDGMGYYQEFGEHSQEIMKGDVIDIPPEIKHWYGSAPDSWLSFVTVEVPSANGYTEWFEEVSDEEYNKLTE